MVTIEGSVTPSAELPRGVQRTVQYTERIARLVKRGFVVIVDELEGKPHESSLPLTPIPAENQLPPADGQEHVAEGTGEPNVGIEAPTDGTPVDLSPDGPGESAPAGEQSVQTDEKPHG